MPTDYNLIDSGTAVSNVTTDSARAGIAPNQFDYARHREILAAGKSENTRKTYRQAVRHFVDWGGRLPSTEHQVIEYLMAFEKSLNPRTLELRLAGISAWHSYQGMPDPTSSKTVKQTMARIGRLNGRPKRKAMALVLPHLQTLCNHLALDRSLRARRDHALILLGFHAGLRRSELVKVTIEDIQWREEGLVLTLPRSKTDQTGEGIVKAVPSGAGNMCPVAAVRAWLEIANIAVGPVFRTIGKWGNLESGAVPLASVTGILRAWAHDAGIPGAEKLTSHSLRRGMATSAHVLGASSQAIQRQGGWKHQSTVQGYIDEANLFSDNASAKISAAASTT